jgi:hypothetical protein
VAPIPCAGSRLAAVTGGDQRGEKGIEQVGKALEHDRCF